MHKTSSDGYMAYSYYGEIETKSLTVGASVVEYNVTKFEFQTPILINGSAVVEVFGSNSLSVSSKEGIYIGVDIAVGKTKAQLQKTVGGFCVSGKTATGNITVMIII